MLSFPILKGVTMMFNLFWKETTILILLTIKQGHFQLFIEINLAIFCLTNKASRPEFRLLLICLKTYHNQGAQHRVTEYLDMHQTQHFVENRRHLPMNYPYSQGYRHCTINRRNRTAVPLCLDRWFDHVYHELQHFFCVCLLKNITHLKSFSKHGDLICNFYKFSQHSFCLSYL